MRQMKLPFSAEDLLHVYTVVRSKREPRTPLLKGSHYLHLRNLCQPQTRLVTDNPDKDLFLDEFVWVSSNWEFWARDDGLWLFLRHNGHLLDSKCFLYRIFIFVEFFMLILILAFIDVQISSSQQ